MREMIKVLRRVCESECFEKEKERCKTWTELFFTRLVHSRFAD